MILRVRDIWTSRVGRYIKNPRNLIPAQGKFSDKTCLNSPETLLCLSLHKNGK